ncbi:sensor domain-containing diguanylate cyclase [Novilysobacter spongiicola]|uniref:sensor domain-containing diguanylate cyclase n=1 Tax=Novilysobacter spongiicola TaxID=435289 RepID=UPI00135669C0|nr:diguanylate cyclase [Lysobacter spongiicola]
MPDTLTRLRPYRYPSMALAAGLLLAVGVAMVWGIAELKRGITWVDHSYRVISEIDGGQVALLKSESAARGYRRTGAAAQQADYLLIVPQVLEHPDNLVRLTDDNPEQNERARRWRDLVHTRLGELERLMDDTQATGTADEAINRDVRFSRMRRASTLANEMRVVERKLLVQRRATTDQRATQLTMFVVLGTAIPVVLLGLLLTGLLRENGRARKLEREARSAMRELEASLAQRDRLSEQRRILGIYAGMLQSAEDVTEAFSLTVETLEKLLPQAGGRFYTLHPSADIADTAARFGTEAIASADVLAPNQCWALRRGQPHRTDDEHGHIKCQHLDQAVPLAGIWTLCVPLIAHGTSLGMLHVSAHERDGTANNDTTLVEAIAEQLSLAIANLHLRETLRLQSLRDPLTGLFNRRYLEENLNRELQRCARRGLPLTVMMLDVDHFKSFNDEYGHAAGDALLSQIGQTLGSLVREEDIACRYGGEEFTVVLPEAGAGEAALRAEGIRSEIGSTTVTHLRSTLGPRTISIGVATFPADGDTPAQLLAKADRALYEAKAQGRDRVVSA